MDQTKRDGALEGFRSGRISIPLAVDVAARRLHVAGVRFVANYDFPGCLEQYVHRCGRADKTNISHKDETEKTTSCDTAAADNPTVYSFFDREMAPMARDVFELLRSCDAWIDQNLVALVGKRGGDTTGLEYNNGKRKRRRCGGGGAKGPNCGGGGGDGVTKRKTRARGSAAGKKGSLLMDRIGEDDEDDEFSSIGNNRIVLQRASHVSDAESDTDNS